MNFSTLSVMLHGEILFSPMN